MKHDWWNEYDPAEHKKLYKEYKAVEAERQHLHKEEIDKSTVYMLAC